MNVSKTAGDQGSEAPPERLRKTPVAVLNPLHGHEYQGSPEHGDEGIQQGALEEFDVHDAGKVVHPTPDEEKHAQGPDRAQDPDCAQDASGVYPMHASRTDQQKVDGGQRNGGYEIDPVTLPVPPFRFGQTALEEEIQEEEQAADRIRYPEHPEGGPGKGGFQDCHRIPGIT